MNKILIIIVFISLTFNILQFNNKNTILVNKTIISENKAIDSINKNCYYMYIGNYINSEDILEFDNFNTKKCLLNNIFKKGYEVNGVNTKILKELLIFKNNSPDSEEIKGYINALKKRFYIKTETINYDAMKIALKIISDKNFEEKVIKEGIYIKR